MPLLYRYRSLALRSPAITLAGRMTRPKPLIDVSLVGPQKTRIVVGLLDTGADDTIFSDALAAQLGIDLTNAPEGESSGVGGTPAVRLRFATVTLRLATVSERRGWPALVGFTAAPLRFPLLGYAGVLHYFSANFHGDREEVELTVNSLYPGT
jgi:hypothetical protein